MKFQPPQYQIRNSITASVRVVLADELKLYIDSQDTIDDIKSLKVNESRSVGQLEIMREV